MNIHEYQNRKPFDKVNPSGQIRQIDYKALFTHRKSEVVFSA